MSNNQIFIAAGRAITTVSDSDNSIFGSNATTDEVVKITDATATNIIVDANVERVQFTGASTDYKYLVVGTNLKIYNAAGTLLVSTIGVQADETAAQLAAGAKLGTQLTFADGTVDAKITGLNAITIGDQAVSTTTAAAVTIPTAKIDASLASAPIPVFSVTGAATATEGGNALFTVTLANPSSTTATTVKYALTGLNAATTSADYGTAVAAGTNVTDAAGTLTFAPGATTTATVTVPVTFDTALESGEGVTLTLSNPLTGTVAGLLTTPSFTTAFADAPQPTFVMTSTAVAGVSTQEGKTITYTVTPSSKVVSDTVFNLNITGQALGAISATAIAGDFSAAPPIIFHANDTAAQSFVVAVVSDGSVEGIEAYKAQLLDNSFNAVGTAFTGTINDATPTITLAGSATVSEGSSVVYTATSDMAAPTGGLTIPFTLGGTATAADYTTSSTTGTITIPAGLLTGTLTVNALPDNLTETTVTVPAETVTVALGSLSGTTINTTPVSTTITDSSLSLATNAFSLTGSTTVNEGSSVVYTVTRGAATTVATTVAYTIGGTATSGTDYTAQTGTLTFAIGEPSKTITVPVTADLLTEGSETMIVTLGTITPATDIVATGLGTITTTIADTSVAVVGQTFTLTTAPDSTGILLGSAGTTSTAGADIFNALVDYTAASVATSASTTYNITDAIDGGNGSDVLNVIVTGSPNAGVTLAATTVSNVETLNIRGVETVSQIMTVAAGNFTGLTALNSDRGSDALTITGLANTTSVGLIGNASVTNGALTATYVTTATSPVLNLSGGTIGTSAVGITAAGATTFTINSTGTAANSIGVITQAVAPLVTINAAAGLTSTGLTLAAATTLTVNGAAATSITDSLAAVEVGTITSATLRTINASGLTNGGFAGVLTTGLTSFVGGQGNDSITTATLTATVAGQINAGAGTGDRLIVAAAADVNSATKGAEFTGFEILRDNVNGTVTPIDISLIPGITSIELNAAGTTISGLSATQAAAIKLLQTNAAGTIALASTSGLTDTVNVTLANPTAATATSLTGLVITGVENFNVINQATAASTVSFGVGSGIKAITLTGTVSTTTTLDIDNQTAALATVNAAGLTGTGGVAILDTTGSHALISNTITGTANADTFTLGAVTAFDTMASGVVVGINAGSGNDGISLGTAQLYTGGSGYVSVDGGAGTDTLTLLDTALGTVSDNVFVRASNLEKLTLNDTGAMNLTTGGSFNSAFNAGSVTITATAISGNTITVIDTSIYTGNVTETVTNAAVTTAATTLTTGSGADTLNITLNGVTTGVQTITTGAGIDNITLTHTDSALATTGKFVITPGAGADITDISAVVRTSQTAISGVIYTVGATDSTTTAFDKVTGFYKGAGATPLADTIDFVGSAIKPANAVAATTVTGFSAATLQEAVSTAGLLTFTGTSAASITEAQAIAAGIQMLGLVADTETFVWAGTSNTYVFNHNVLGDSIVELVGTTGATAVGAAAVTALLVGIA